MGSQSVSSDHLKNILALLKKNDTDESLVQNLRAELYELIEFYQSRLLKTQSDFDIYKKNCDELQRMGRIGTWEYNIETQHFFGSDHAMRIYGFDPEKETLSTEDVESCIPERERVHRALVDLIESDKEYNLIFKIQPVNTSEMKTIHSMAWKFIDDLTGQAMVKGMLIDITEQEKIQEALIQTESTFKSIFNKIPDPVYIQETKTTRIVMANQASEKLYGYSSDELVKLTAADLDTPEEALKVPSRINELQKKKNLLFRTYHRTKNGEVIPIEINVHIIQFQGKDVLFTVCRDLRKRLQEEAALKESERRLSNMISNFQGMAYSCLFDKEWTMTFLSPVVENISGYKPEELIGNRDKSFKDIIHPEDRKKVWDIISKKAREKEQYNLTYRILTKNGETKWVREQGTPVFEDGGFIHLEGLIHDITREHQRALLQEAVLKVSRDDVNAEETIQLGLNAAEELSDSEISFIHFVDPDLKRITHSKLSVRTEKTSPMYFDFREYPADEAGIWMDSFRFGKAFIYNDYSSVAYRRGLPDKHLAIRRFLSVPVIENRQVVAVLGVGNKKNEYNDEDRHILEDFINSIWSSIKKKQIQEELKEISTRLDLAVRSAHIGIWELDLVTNKLIWDKRMYELYGVKEENFSGAYDAWQQGVHPDDIMESDRQVHEAISENKRFDTEFRIMTPEGEVKFIRAYATVIRDPEGIPLKMVGINYDITHEKEKSRQLLERNRELVTARDRAEESDKLKSAFLANMSHELRTPMNSIIGFSTLLSETGGDPDMAREYSSHIRKSGEQLMHLINDIVDLSKIESNQMIMEKSPVVINELLQEIYDTLKSSPSNLSNKAVDFILDIPEKSLTIHTDPFRFRQIMTNLVQNAFKFTYKGEIRISYSCLTQEHEKMIEFHVRDTGVGIAKEKQTMIFERFRQAESADFHEGTGLGLSISKGFVELLGGYIGVSSEKGLGSDFYFALPLEKAKPDADVS